MNAHVDISQASIVRFWDFVRDQPCQHCGIQGYTQLAHYDGYRDNQFGAGMRRKAHWLMVMPLCGPHNGLPGCHADFDQSRVSHFNELLVRKIDKSEMMLAYIAKTHIAAVEQGVLSP